MDHLPRCVDRMVYVLVLFLAAMSACTMAEAYVLQGSHVLDLMLEKLGTVRQLSVSQTLQFYGDASQVRPTALKEILRFRFPEKFRADIQGENTQRIHVLNGESVLTIVDGKVEVETETRFDLYKDILLFRYRPLLEKRLARFGVDVSVSSLGRLEEALVYIVGAHYPDISVPQVWVDKKTFLPLRWIITRTTGGNHSDSLEVRYSQWRRFGDAHYPTRIDFLQGGSLVRHIQVDDVVVNGTFPRGLFDTEYLESVYRPAGTVSTGRIEMEALNEVQETIEDFGKIFE